MCAGIHSHSRASCIDILINVGPENRQRGRKITWPSNTATLACRSTLYDVCTTTKSLKMHFSESVPIKFLHDYSSKEKQKKKLRHFLKKTPKTSYNLGPSAQLSLANQTQKRQ